MSSYRVTGATKRARVSPLPIDVTSDEAIFPANLFTRGAQVTFPSLIEVSIEVQKVTESATTSTTTHKIPFVELNKEKATSQIIEISSDDSDPRRPGEGGNSDIIELLLSNSDNSFYEPDDVTDSNEEINNDQIYSRDNELKEIVNFLDNQLHSQESSAGSENGDEDEKEDQGGDVNMEEKSEENGSGESDSDGNGSSFEFDSEDNHNLYSQPSTQLSPQALSPPGQVSHHSIFSSQPPTNSMTSFKDSIIIANTENVNGEIDHLLSNQRFFNKNGDDDDDGDNNVNDEDNNQNNAATKLNSSDVTITKPQKSNVNLEKKTGDVLIDVTSSPEEIISNISTHPLTTNNRGNPIPIKNAIKTDCVWIVGMQILAHLDIFFHSMQEMEDIMEWIRSLKNVSWTENHEYESLIQQYSIIGEVMHFLYQLRPKLYETRKNKRNLPPLTENFETTQFQKLLSGNFFNDLANDGKITQQLATKLNSRLNLVKLESFTCQNGNSNSNQHTNDEFLQVFLEILSSEWNLYLDVIKKQLDSFSIKSKQIKENIKISHFLNMIDPFASTKAYLQIDSIPLSEKCSKCGQPLKKESKIETTNTFGWCVGFPPTKLKDFGVFSLSDCIKSTYKTTKQKILCLKEGCGQRNAMNVSYTFKKEQMPPYMIFNVQKPSGMGTLNRLFCDIELDLNSYCKSVIKNSISTKYQLKAIVFRQARNDDSEHFYIFLKNEKNWFICNDDKIEMIAHPPEYNIEESTHIRDWKTFWERLQVEGSLYTKWAVAYNTTPHFPVMSIYEKKGLEESISTFQTNLIGLLSKLNKIEKELSSIGTNQPDEIRSNNITTATTTTTVITTTTHKNKTNQKVRKRDNNTTTATVTTTTTTTTNKPEEVVRKLIGNHDIELLRKVETEYKTVNHNQWRDLKMYFKGARSVFNLREKTLEVIANSETNNLSDLAKSTNEYYSPMIDLVWYKENESFDNNLTKTYPFPNFDATKNFGKGRFWEIQKGNHDWGAFATRDLQKGWIVATYGGKVLYRTELELLQKCEQKLKEEIKNSNDVTDNEIKDWAKIYKSLDEEEFVIRVEKNTNEKIIDDDKLALLDPSRLSYIYDIGNNMFIDGWHLKILGTQKQVKLKENSWVKDWGHIFNHQTRGATNARLQHHIRVKKGKKQNGNLLLPSIVLTKDVKKGEEIRVSYGLNVVQMAHFNKVNAESDMSNVNTSDPQQKTTSTITTSKTTTTPTNQPISDLSTSQSTKSTKNSISDQTVYLDLNNMPDDIEKNLFEFFEAKMKSEVPIDHGWSSYTVAQRLVKEQAFPFTDATPCVQLDGDLLSNNWTIRAGSLNVSNYNAFDGKEKFKKTGTVLAFCGGKIEKQSKSNQLPENALVIAQNNNDNIYIDNNVTRDGILRGIQNGRLFEAAKNSACLIKVASPNERRNSLQKPNCFWAYLPVDEGRKGLIVMCLSGDLLKEGEELLISSYFEYKTSIYTDIDMYFDF